MLIVCTTALQYYSASWFCLDEMYLKILGIEARFVSNGKTLISRRGYERPGVGVQGVGSFGNASYPAASPPAAPHQIQTSKGLDKTNTQRTHD